MQFIKIDPNTKKPIETLDYKIVLKEAKEKGLNIKILSKSDETITGYLITPGELIKSEKLKKLNQRNNKTINKSLNINSNTSMNDVTIKTNKILKYFEKGTCLLQYKFHPKVPEFKIEMYINHIKDHLTTEKYKYQYNKLILSVQIK